MDPIQKILRDLDEKLETLEDQILGGRLQSFEMYQALTAQRQMLTSMIADIKEHLADDDTTEDKPAET